MPSRAVIQVVIREVGKHGLGTRAILVPELVRALDDTELRVRHATLMSLLFIGPEAAGARDRIQAVIRTCDPEIRSLATRTLEAIGSEE